MKQTHRSAKFDKLLNSKVKITFIDGAELTGILKWKSYRGDFISKCNTYYLQLDTDKGPEYITFYKVHVRRIEEV